MYLLDLMFPFIIQILCNLTILLISLVSQFLKKVYYSLPLSVLVNFIVVPSNFDL